jgi:hypothetical protein
MSAWTPCKRRDFISKLRQLGFEGPFLGKRHEFMIFAGQRQTIPNNPEYSVPQVRMLVRQVELRLGRTITAQAWATL